MSDTTLIVTPIIRTDEAIILNIKESNGNKLTNISIIVKQPYTVAFNSNGGIGTMENQILTYDTPSELTTNTFTKSGYTFSGWSSSTNAVARIYDNSEYTGTKASGESGWTDFKQYILMAPFSSGDIYQLDVDVKGSGTLDNYFYGASGYLQVANWTSPTTGNSGTAGDGHNPISLTDEYTHYTVRFTLGSSGNGNVEKRVLFRVHPGNTATIKNVRFHKVTTSSEIYLDGQTVNNLATSGTYNLYAIWKWNGEYGTSISSLYSNLYVGTDSSGALVTKTNSGDTYYNGNYALPRSLWDVFYNNVQSTTSDKSLTSGVNTITGLSIANSWILVHVHCGGYTTGLTLGNLTLTFNGIAYNLQSSVSNRTNRATCGVY